ncbi:RNA-directed DNA polymerase, eukaryota [Tanacetum coccineum]
MIRRTEVEGRANQVTHSIFVTNFPTGTSAKQLWDICEQYGKVVDSFIPARISKEVWIGKFKLRFNLARFQRGAKNEGVKNVEQKQPVRINVPDSSSFSRSFVAIVSNKARPHKIEKHMEDKPVKLFDSMPNLGVVLKDEGLDTWFSAVQPWKNDFRVDERVLWVDVEGIPLVAWTNKTFMKVAKRWGELLFTKDLDDNNLWHKRLCVVTKVEDFIMESFKIIIKGKVTVVRAHEIIGWIPDFMEEENDINSDSGDDESENLVPHTDICSGVKGKGSIDSDGKRDMDTKKGDGREEKSDDPFGIYNLLNQKDKNIEAETVVSDDFSKPPGFSNFVVEDNVASGKEEGQVNNIGQVQKTFSNMIQARKHVEKEQQSECNTNSTKGGGGSDKDSMLPKGKCPRTDSSLLEKMNEFVEIGQTMGFSMEGCINDIEKPIARQGDETKMEEMDDNVVRSIWGNMDFEFRHSPSVDCVVLVEGVWKPTGSKLLMIGVPIILKECDIDYGPIPFKMFHSWFDIEGFEQLVKDAWQNEVVVDLNEMSYLKKKFQMLSSVIGSLVSKEESAFIHGHQILDGPLILSDVIDWCNQKKRKAMIFKVDFEKAYDSVRDSILVNGSPTQEFYFEQGLRQGDPLSSFLFLLVMEDLHISFVRAMDGGFFKGVEPGMRKVSWFSWNSVVASTEVKEENKEVSIHDKVHNGLLHGFRRSPRGEQKTRGYVKMDGRLTRWLKAIPIKFNVLAWRLASNKLSMRFNMSVRGLEIQSINCLVYHVGVETSDHLFFSCSVASSNMAKVLGWWGIPDIGISSYQDWVIWFKVLRLKKDVKYYLEGTMFVSW